MVEVLNKISSVLDDSKIKGKTNSENMLKYLQGLIDFDFLYNNELYKIKYSLGRKDYVLARMYEDNYITIDELKNAVLIGMNYKFGKSKITIDSPHFVFWVLELLTQANNKYIGEYGEDVLKK
jgi:membrane carboxypeptidase/penicillin-binding protein